MEHAVLLTKQPNNGYIARSLLLPDIVVTADDEAEALAQIRTVLAEVQRFSRVVHVDVPNLGETQTNPWLELAGAFADDPTWEEFQATIASQRQVIGDSQP